jgi:hypothetical protein
MRVFSCCPVLSPCCVKAVASSSGCHMFLLLVVPCVGVFIQCCLPFLLWRAFLFLLWRVCYFAKEGLLFDMKSLLSQFLEILLSPLCGVLALSAMIYTLLSFLVGYLLQLSCDGLYLGKIVPKSI